MVVQHVIDIDFVARNNTPVVHLTQYDDGLPYLVVRTFQNGAPLVLSSNEVTASLRFTKPDGNFILSPGTVTETEVGFKIPSSMTVFQGKYPGKVELKDAVGQIICSATIVFDIDANPVQKDAVESDSDYKDYINQVLGKIPGFDGYSKDEADAKFASIDAVVFTNTSTQVGDGSAEVATVRGDRTYLIRFDASVYSGNIVTYVLRNGQVIANTAQYDQSGNLGSPYIRNNADGTVTVFGYTSVSGLESIVCSVIPLHNFNQQQATCFIEGTKVLLRNKDTGEVTEKNIEDVQVGDYLAFWSPAKGRLTQTRAVVPPVVGECNKYHRLFFSDGKTVDVFGNQFFWEVDHDQLINWTHLVPGESRVCTATGDIIIYTGSEEVVLTTPVRHYTLMTFRGRYLANGIQVGDKVELFYPRLTTLEYAKYWNELTDGDRNYFKCTWAEGMHRRNWRFSEEYHNAMLPLISEQVRLNKEIEEKQAYLDKTDYLVMKLSEGLITEDEFAPIRLQRQSSRDCINLARENLKAIVNDKINAQEQVKTKILGTLHKHYEGAFINKTRAEVKKEDNVQ